MCDYEVTSKGLVIGEPMRGYRALTSGIPEPVVVGVRDIMIPSRDNRPAPRKTSRRRPRKRSKARKENEMKSTNAPMTSEQQLREMNEALLVSSVRQHELTEQAQKAEAALRESHAKLQEHADELDRFNRVAVGRELRMIELKKEVDEVCQRYGEAARYPLEFDKQVGIQESTLAEQPPPTMRPSDSIVPLESVLCTEEFARRPSRPPDYRTENHALTALAQALADSPGTILQTLAEKILEVFQADSAGISLLTKDNKRFYWPAIAGMWKPHIGGGTPRDFGPCGEVLDRNAPLVFTHLERRYPYFLPVTPPVEECLLVPFYVEGKSVGTIWAIAHDESRKFDAEDLRRLESLGRFAAAAYQATEQRHQDQDSRRAALNLMGEAVQARQATENLNVKLRESHARFEALFDASPVGMYLVDAELRIRMVSRTARPTFGDIGELIGRDFVEVMHILWSPKTADEIVTHFRQTLETGEPYHAPEFSEERTDRKEFEYYDWQIQRISLPDGQYGVVCYISTSPSACGCPTTLRQYAAELSESDRHKNEFLAMLAHELRNPLAPIRNALQILRLARGATGRHPNGGRHDGAPGRPDGAPGGRPARREPHQPGQDRTPPGAGRNGLRSSITPSKPPSRSTRTWSMN